MKTKNRTKFFVRLMCWILAAMMVLGLMTYILYALGGVATHIH